MVSLNSEQKEESEQSVEKKQIISKAPVLQYHEHRRWGCWGCFILVVLFIVAISGTFGFFLAKSGLVRVPVLTNYLYKPVEPTRVVVVSSEDVMNIEQDLMDELSSQAIEQQKTVNPNTPVFKFAISEDQLTALVIKNFSELDTQQMGFTLQNPQIVVTNDYIEMYCHVTQPSDSVLLLQFVPMLKNGLIELSVTSAVIGNLSVPSVALNYLVDQFLESNINAMINQTISDKGSIKSISLSNTKIFAEIISAAPLVAN